MKNIIKKTIKFTPRFLRHSFCKIFIFLRKSAGFISSRALYLLIGLFLALAIFGVQAAWNSTVSSGQPLTSALWNDVVAKLVDLDNKGVSSGFCVFSRTQAGCPAGWTRDASFDGRTISGAATPGGTGGASTHAHTIPALYLAETGSPTDVSAGGNTYKKYTNVSNSGGASSWPPYMNVIVCCKN
ncbi:hypothetical protein L6248_00165 [Candidatus Parcubacteria bacterium]|nr:hypothetical protein [Candidatus Parcubacteria bacterium]